MPKIIIVSGKQGSGKTSSITRAMNQLGIHISSKGKDVLISAYLSTGFTIGIASGGDTLAVVNGNIDFFSSIGKDASKIYYYNYIIFASRSKGKPLKAIMDFANSLGIMPIIINTTKLQNPSKSQIEAATLATTKQILSHIL